MLQTLSWTWLSLLIQHAYNSIWKYRALAAPSNVTATVEFSNQSQHHLHYVNISLHRPLKIKFGNSMFSFSLQKAVFTVIWMFHFAFIHVVLLFWIFKLFLLWITYLALVEAYEENLQTKANNSSSKPHLYVDQTTSFSRNM